MRSPFAFITITVGSSWALMFKFMCQDVLVLDLESWSWIAPYFLDFVSFSYSFIIIYIYMYHRGGEKDLQDIRQGFRVGWRPQ